MFNKPSLLLKKENNQTWKGLEDPSQDQVSNKTSLRTTYCSTSWTRPLKALPIFHVCHCISIHQILTAADLQETLMSDGRFLIYLENKITETSLY